MKEYRLFGRRICSPFTIPSGIITTSSDTMRYFSRKSNIGFFLTKSTGQEKKPGNREVIYCAANPRLDFSIDLLERSCQNAVGLTNIGAEAAKEEYSNLKMPEDMLLIASIIGENVSDFVKTAKTLEDVVDAFEINVSCPHSPGYGVESATDADAIALVVKAQKENTRKPVFPKLAPNIETIGRIAKAAMEAGADAISAINTFGPFESDFLSYGKGGLSGAAIKDLGVRCVAEIRRATGGKIPIIACGGIFCIKDVFEYRDAGASFFGVGTALTGMDTKQVINFFADLQHDFENGTTWSMRNEYRGWNMRYSPYLIEKAVQVNDDLKIFYFDGEIEAKPGQYVFAMLGRNEKPFSIADNKPLTIAVRKVGEFTSKLFDLNERDLVYVRGPYGRDRDYEIGGNVCLIGGGTGVAPVNFFAKKHRTSNIFMGFTGKDEIFFSEEIQGRTKHLKVSLDNGLVGQVCRDLESNLKRNKYDSFVICGPEKMMAEATRIISRLNPDASVLVLLERYMKCGAGICGSCAVETGLRICVDGPAMLLNELGSDFGRFKKDSYGRKVGI